MYTYILKQEINVLLNTYILIYIGVVPIRFPLWQVAQASLHYLRLLCIVGSFLVAVICEAIDVSRSISSRTSLKRNIFLFQYVSPRNYKMGGYINGEKGGYCLRLLGICSSN